MCACICVYVCVCVCVCVCALALAHVRTRSLSLFIPFTHTPDENIFSLRERCMNHDVLQHTHTHSLTHEIDLYWWANSYNLVVGLPFYQSRCPAILAFQSHVQPHHWQPSFARLRVFGTEACFVLCVCEQHKERERARARVRESEGQSERERKREWVCVCEREYRCALCMLFNVWNCGTKYPYVHTHKLALLQHICTRLQIGHWITYIYTCMHMITCI